MKLMRTNRHDNWDWPVFGQLTNLRDEINRLFEAPLFNGGGTAELFNTWSPALDLYEDKDNLVVQAEVPGFKKEDLDISFQDGSLTITGERKHETKEGHDVSRSERFYGKFHRTFVLPKAVDVTKVKARYKDGILTITLPKAEEAKPRQISVT